MSTKAKRDLTILAMSVMNGVSNYRCLPPTYTYNGRSYLIHEDPVAFMNGSEVSKNFDFLITTQDTDVSTSIILEPHEFFVSNRLSKVRQQYLINKCPDVPNLRRLKTYHRTDSLHHPRSIEVSEGIKLVIKPIMGARGLGTFILDTTHINLSTFEGYLKYLISELNITAGDEDPKIRKWCSDAIVKLMKEPTFKKGLDYYPGKEDYVGEGLMSYRNSSFIVQDYVEDVVDEYRLICYAGELKYAQLRKREGEDFRQATGSGTVNDRPFDASYLETLLSDQGIDIEEVLSMVKHLGPDLMAIDLFTTSQSKWGVFEYSNQFGTTGIPANVNLDIHKGFIDYLLNSRSKE